MRRVYVAAPIRQGDRPANIHRAIVAGEQLRAAGHAPFIPHLGELWAIVTGRGDGDPEEWFTYDNAWLDVCDALIRLPGPSQGSDLEVERARANGIPVYTTVEAFLASQRGRAAREERML